MEKSKEDRIKEYKAILDDAIKRKKWNNVEYVSDQLYWELDTKNGLLKE